MKYFEFKLDNSIKFNSMHSIDYSGWKPKLKLLTDFDLVIVKDNHLDLQCSSEKFTVNSGEAFLAIPGQTICLTPNSDVIKGISVLHFSSAHFAIYQGSDIYEISSDRDDMIYLKRKINIGDTCIYDIFQSMFDELKYKRYGYGKKLDLSLSCLLYELHRCSKEKMISGNVQYNYSTGNKYAKIIIDFIHSRYMNHISSKDINELLSLNYDYANTVFKQVTGFTIMDYVNRVRISMARQLIESTSFQLNEIAEMVGIEDSHYFSKMFKKIEGISPSLLKKT